jgi:hypothetical protein
MNVYFATLSPGLLKIMVAHVRLIDGLYIYGLADAINGL